MTEWPVTIAPWVKSQRSSVEGATWATAVHPETKAIAVAHVVAFVLIVVSAWIMESS
jgi:hypothetical protein